MKAISPEVLLLSNKHDYSTDHIAILLKSYGVKYLRLDRDTFNDMAISLFPIESRIVGKNDNYEFIIDLKNLKSIYFRAPIYLRDNYQPKLTPDEQFSRSQWAAFVRSLIVYENIIWVNHPKSTYAAEIKPFQLLQASKVGLKVPNTIVTNSIKATRDYFSYGVKTFAFKTIDPIVLNFEEKEGFIYTNYLASTELEQLNEIYGPSIVQEAILPKKDIRVTVIGNKVFAVLITKAGLGINTDWRLEKDRVDYTPIDLPQQVEQKSKELLKCLGLNYGAIDYAFNGKEYYFLEINPTGEWGWLLDKTKFKLDVELCNLLTGKQY